jgi:hypothetical protein
MKYITVLPVFRFKPKCLMWGVFLDGVIYESFKESANAMRLAKELSELNPSAKLNYMKEC